MAEIELRLGSADPNSKDNLSNQLKMKNQIQGECKIAHTELLEFSYLKLFLLVIPVIVSIVGMLILKYSWKARIKLFYWEAGRDKATHIYIRGNGIKQEQIVNLNPKGNQCFFFYKNLKYQLLPAGQCCPVAINYEKQLQQRLNPKSLEQGLSSQEAQKRKQLYGKNEHIVEAPKYYEYMYDVMTEPYFLIQYLASTIYIIQKLIEPAILLLSATIITTSINYLLLYISYRKIKQLAQIVVDVEVLRDHRFTNLPSTELVPGDIFIPKHDLYCDVVLVNGQVYVNESNLTGQSVPIGKYALDRYEHYKKDDTSRWIYEGSKLLSTHNPLAMVMHTGYASKRGRILRKILNKTSATPHFFVTCIYFLLINWIIGIIVYLGTMSVRIANDNLQRIIIFLNFLLILTFTIPPACPIYFNVVYSFSLVRLKWKNILGTDPEKTVEGAHLKIMCFDKTGTLTQDKVEVNKVYHFQPTKQMNITNRAEEQRGLDEKVFGSCHTVKYFEDKPMGDQIDLKMFFYSQYKLSATVEEGSCFDVTGTENMNEVKLKILKVYQYESKFQSMSVLVHDKYVDKYYVFAKGAPQIIHNNSTVKYDYFDHLLQNQSYGGFRTISYGYKQIRKSDIDKWKEQSRDNFIKGIKILGLVVFENKLKEDSRKAIELLKQGDIESRIITGDNIYIAIETAIRCSILSRNEEIVVIEGKQQAFEQMVAMEDQKILTKRFSFRQEKINVSREKISYQEYMNITNSVVIDNDFLKLKQKFQDLQMTPCIKVYSRISPQNKAFIVRTLKQQITAIRDAIPLIQRIMGTEVDKVGMVGDGANDLLAIREADIGVGISNCDSSYAASFSIQTLSGLDILVRQSKCCQRSIIQIVRFITITSFTNVPLMIIMETEAVFFSPFQLIFLNLTKYIILPGLLAMGRPCQEQTPHKPSSNFLRLENQLMHWGNVILATIGILAIMIFFRTQPEYVWNTSTATLETGWVFQASLVTAQFIFNNIYPIGLVFAVYVSSPWKEPIYKNWLLMLAIVLNLFSSVPMSFLIPQLSSLFTFADMSMSSMGYVFMISAVATIATMIYSELINCMKLYVVQQEPAINFKEQRDAIFMGESAECTRVR